MLPAIFLFFMMMLVPESPRWLARKDRWDDCHNVLARVHGKGDPNHPFVSAEFQDIKEMCEFERQNNEVSYLDLFRPKMINRTMIGVMTQVWSQLTGMNVMSMCSHLLRNHISEDTEINESYSVLHYLRLCDGWISG